MKKCKKCGVNKKLEDFHKDKYNKDGYTYNCKKCRNECKIIYNKKNSKRLIEYAREYRSTHKEELKKYNKKHYAENKEKYRTSYKDNPIPVNEANKKSYRKNIYKRLLNSAKYRAKKNNIVFDIVEADLNIGDLCPILEEKFQFGNSKNKPCKLSRTIDRLDPKKGYVKNNVLVVSSLANVVKSNGTLEDLEKIITNLDRIIKYKKPWKEICKFENYFALQNMHKCKISLLESCRHRAKTRNRVYKLTVDDIIIPKFCPLLGIELIKGTGKVWKHSPTIDRLDNKKGYVPENIIICSHKANRMKNECTINQLRKIHKNYMRIQTES